MTGPLDPNSRAISGMEGMNEPEARTAAAIIQVQV